MQHTPVDDASRERLHQLLVWNAAEVVGKVGVDGVRLPPVKPLLHLCRRLLGIAARPVRKLLGWKISFEDRFQH
jgi:hypothetical protein